MTPRVDPTRTRAPTRSRPSAGRRPTPRRIRRGLRTRRCPIARSRRTCIRPATTGLPSTAMANARAAGHVGQATAAAPVAAKGQAGHAPQCRRPRSICAHVANEIVAEIDGALSDAQADELARRHGLARLQSQNFPLIGATIGLFRITDRRSVETVSRELRGRCRRAFGAAELPLSAAGPERRADRGRSRAICARQAAACREAHTLAHGTNVTIAVIDSGIDVRHPELADSIADSFDALGSKEGPHVHGTGIAGAIVAHARLMGSAPAARILAIRAFGTAPGGAESTSFVILQGPRLRGRARRADRQYELRRAEGSADRARHRRDRCARASCWSQPPAMPGRNRRRSIRPPTPT